MATESRTLLLTPDELLTITRSVRNRLDLTRPVEPEIIEVCLRIAQQAPTGSLSQGSRFLVVTDPTKRRALADIYRRGWSVYCTWPNSYPNLRYEWLGGWCSASAWRSAPSPTTPGT